MKFVLNLIYNLYFYRKRKRTTQGDDDTQLKRQKNTNSSTSEVLQGSAQKAVKEHRKCGRPRKNKSKNDIQQLPNDQDNGNSGYVDNL